MILFTQWSKGAELVMSLLLIFIFTLTTNVIFDPSTAMAGDVSQRDTAGETAGESKDAQAKLSGAADGVGDFFGGIMNWITGVTDAVNNMWGMENGSSMAIVVNGSFYLLLIVGVVFGGKMVFNIIKDLIGGKVSERYEKPSFRKK
ncbi:MAG: hypothetical protein V3R23_04950 [Nitrospinaceae bacterium]